MYVIATWILGIVSVLGVGGTVAAFIFAPTVAAPILEKVTAMVLACKTCLVIAALVGVALGSFWYGREGQYDKGHAAAIAEIASEDASVIADATAKRNIWKECRARSGTWDQATGDCK
jgi:hypothetical protein